MVEISYLIVRDYPLGSSFQLSCSPYLEWQFQLHSWVPMWKCMLFLGHLTWTHCTASSGFCSPGNHATIFFIPQIVWPHWGVLTVTVKAQFSIEVVSGAFGIFPVDFRTKCLLWHAHMHFDCAGSHKMLAAEVSSAIFPLNFHTKWLL